jgi:hypothetical protein
LDACRCSFYVLHIALAHLAAGIIAYREGLRHVAVLTADFMQVPQEWGSRLPAVYLAWALVWSRRFIPRAAGSPQ